MSNSKTLFSDSLKQRFFADLTALGISPGDVVLVHTSLKGLQTPKITSQFVIESLLELLTEQGTLLIPSLSYAFVKPENPIFNILETKACIGTLPECFRMEYAQYRSLHPTHSVCAHGKLARVLTQCHALDDTPVGEHSPFRLLTEYGGKILMLGCGLRPNTFMHGVEEYAKAPYPLSKDKLQYTLILEDGRQIAKEYYPHEFGGLEQRYDRLESLLNQDELKMGSLLGGVGYCMDAAAVLKKGTDQIKKNPCFFVSGEK